MDAEEALKAVRMQARQTAFDKFTEAWMLDVMMHGWPDESTPDLTEDPLLPSADFR